MKKFSDIDIDRIIQMCWEDRTPFDAIKTQFEISEKEIISIMRNNLKEKSFLKKLRIPYSINQHDEVANLMHDIYHF